MRPAAKIALPKRHSITCGVMPKYKGAPTVDIDLSAPCAHWPDYKRTIKKAVALTLAADDFWARTGARQADISIVLTDDTHIKKLNKTYRSMNKATNVLSFPQITREDNHDLPELSLGDVIIAFETVEREAREQNKTLKNHLLHMVVHGTLHLLGHDHIEDDMAERMESLEIQILKQMRIKNPYLSGLRMA